MNSKATQAGKSPASAERALALARGLVSIPNAVGLRSTAILPDPDQIPRIRRAVNAAIMELEERSGSRVNPEGIPSSSPGLARRAYPG